MGVRCSQYTLTRLQVSTTVSLNDEHFGENTEHEYEYVSCPGLMLSVTGCEAAHRAWHLAAPTFLNQQSANSSHVVDPKQDAVFLSYVWGESSASQQSFSDTNIKQPSR